MTFDSFSLSPNGMEINATAKGHPDEVIKAFREATRLIFIDKGAWRITHVQGDCPLEMKLDSDMVWWLRANLKTPTAGIWIGTSS